MSGATKKGLGLDLDQASGPQQRRLAAIKCQLQARTGFLWKPTRLFLPRGENWRFKQNNPNPKSISLKPEHYLCIPIDPYISLFLQSKCIRMIAADGQAFVPASSLKLIVAKKFKAAAGAPD